MTTAGTALVGIFVLSVLIEAITEYLGTAIPTKVKPYVAAAFAVIICVAYGADLPAAFGLPAVPYVGSAITGLVIGRGSNYLADLVKRLSVVTAPAQPIDSVVPVEPVAPIEPRVADLPTTVPAATGEIAVTKHLATGHPRRHTPKGDV